MMLIETPCGSVFGVDYHRENAKLCPRNAHDRVCKKGGTEALALVMASYGKAPEEGSGNDRVAGKFGDDFDGELIENDSDCGQSVIAGDLAGIDADGHEACREVTPDVLRDLLAEIPVQWHRSALKAGSVVSARERLDPKRIMHDYSSCTITSRSGNSGGGTPA